jgi:hypothetical protein
MADEDLATVRTSPASHLVPFLLFALLTYGLPWTPLPESLWYPLKTIAVAGALLFFWPAYTEEVRFILDWPAVLGGLLVFLLWIGLEGHAPLIGTPSEYKPRELASGSSALALIAFRLSGAVLVVPLMEEVFWRSFALRFLLGTHYKSIPLGTFSWFSFIVVSIAFGFEHYRWLPGILAGFVYALLLYRSKNLFSPILSHAVTNAMLGGYVLLTGSWTYW